jgi:hypothetical protein
MMREVSGTGLDAGCVRVITREKGALLFGFRATKGALGRVRASFGVSSPGFGRGDRRDPHLGRIRRAGVLRNGEDGEVEAARLRGDDRLDGAVGILGVQRERLRGETEWAGERTLARSRNGEAARWRARRALGAARAAPPRGARREKSRGRRTIVVSRSNPGRSSRLRRTFDEEWLAESDALVLSISIVGGVSLELEIDL